MKTILLKQLRLLNFKGLRNHTIDFNDATNIFGDNGTGKSTIFDAFTWVLFGKDAQDRKDYGVKTLDKDNNEIPKIDHEVTAVLEVNGETVILKRTLKENWVKKRGTAVPEFTGNVTEFHWNDVPMQAKEYQSKIASIMDDQVFKLITNPLAFNALKWQDQRAVLTALCGELDDAELLNKLATTQNKEAVANLTNLLNSNKSIDEIKRETAAKRKKISDELKTIPTRIDEVTRNTPAALDFAQIRKDIDAKQEEISSIEKQIADKGAAVQADMDRRANIQEQEIFPLRTRLAELKHEAEAKAKAALTIDKSKLTDLQNRLDTKTGYLTQYQNEVERIKAAIVTGEAEVKAKREAWTAENAKELTFGDNDFHCPTCKREFEEGDVDAKKAEMLESFKTAKFQKLQKINAEGKTLAAALEENKARLVKGVELVNKTNAEVAELRQEHEAEKLRIAGLQTGVTQEQLAAEFLSKSEHPALTAQLAEKTAKLGEAPKVDTAELQTKKTAAQVDLDHLRSQLAIEDSIRKAGERIAQLQKEEETLSDAHIKLEGQEFAIENFIKLRIETLEGRINSQFRFVNFKLFATQINGGIVECCEALINGVPFSNANTASRINAGLDIINTLCSYYQVTAPIFIDNRESVVQLIESPSQIINLFVEEGSYLSVGKAEYTPEHKAKMAKELEKEVA